jgi:hypothetical protein
MQMGERHDVDVFFSGRRPIARRTSSIEPQSTPPNAKSVVIVPTPASISSTLRSSSTSSPPALISNSPPAVSNSGRVDQYSCGIPGKNTIGRIVRTPSTR